MIGFRGISDDVQAAESEAAASGPTKEAQEATNLRLYERALREQRSGCDAEAVATFGELLTQPLLREVDVVRAQATVVRFASAAACHAETRCVFCALVGGRGAGEPRGVCAAAQVSLLQKFGRACNEA